MHSRRGNQPSFLTEEDVARLLSDAELLAVVEETLVELANGRALSGESTLLTLDDDDGLRAFKAMPGVCIARGVAGVKWVGTFARNTERGLARAPGTILLTDAVDGALLGAVAANALTARRTAAMAAVAARHLAPPEAKTVAILGFGAIGQASAALLSRLLALHEFRVWSRSADRLAAAAGALAHDIGADIVPVADPASATACADIVIVATGLTHDAPFLHRSMLRQGALVCAVGSYQEIDGDIIEAADLLIVDDWAAATKRGNLAPAIRAGRLQRSSVTGDLSALVTGHVAKPESSPCLMLVSLLGIGVLDVALAAHLLAIS